MPMLKKGQRLVSVDGQPIDVDSLIASGGQGEVYKVQMNNQNYALKWYHHPSTSAQKREPVSSFTHWNNTFCSTLLPIIDFFGQ